MLWQMPPQLDRMPIGRVCKLVDRFVTDRDRMALQAHAASDLLRRPTMHDAFNHRLPNVREPRQLAEFRTSLARQVVRSHAVVAGQIWHDFVDKRVASDLTKDR